MPDRRKAARPGSRDRRDSVRDEVRMALWIAQPGGSAKEPLKIDNVSLGGLAFRSSESWPEDGAVVVHVHVDEPHELKGKVLWSTERKPRFKLPWRKHADPTYEVGIAFVGDDVEKRRAIVEQILGSEAYQRGLYV